jgi:hypothetical protein
LIFLHVFLLELLAWVDTLAMVGSIDYFYGWPNGNVEISVVLLGE